MHTYTHAHKKTSEFFKGGSIVKKKKSLKLELIQMPALRPVTCVVKNLPPEALCSHL